MKRAAKTFLGLKTSGKNRKNDKKLLFAKFYFPTFLQTKNKRNEKLFLMKI